MDTQKKPWIVTVDMGYGHQRATAPLVPWAHTGRAITANQYEGIPHHDIKTWKQSRSAYEWISRFRNTPGIGQAVFDLYDAFQAIPNFYPRRDLSRPTIASQVIYRAVERGWGKHLIDELSRDPRPLITAFFSTAFMAEVHGYPGEIFCLVTDTDCSRSWVSQYPAKSKIKYFAPTRRVMERLRLYGVPGHHIFLTGFPLPEENCGSDFRVLKSDVAHRLSRLDPEGVFHATWGDSIKGLPSPRGTSARTTLTFAVGGAAAQQSIGVSLIKSSRSLIKSGKLRLILLTGVNEGVARLFRTTIEKSDMGSELGKGVIIQWAEDKVTYFRECNEYLRMTDVLWTKPSELSFYAGLGIPILMADPIGSQEKQNREWLLSLGAAVDALDPDGIREWFFDFVRAGRFAEMALNGYLEAPKYGTRNILSVVQHHTCLPYGAHVF